MEITFLYWAIVIGAGVAFFFVYRKKEPGSGLKTEGFMKDLTALAREGKLDPVIGRTQEIERSIQILTRRSKNNPILIGEAGVGKTAIVEGLAQRIIAGEVPEEIIGKRVLSVDITAMLSGTKYRGEFEDRMNHLLTTVQEANRGIILFIDEIHQLVAAGASEGAIKAEDIIKPALSRGDLQLIGATTPPEYNTYIKHDVTLERRFQPVIVGEPNKADTLAILKGIAPKYESYHNVILEKGVLETIVVKCATLLSNRRFPDKAIDILDEACARVKLATIGEKSTKTKPRVTKSDVLAVISYYRNIKKI
ncbi:MAG: AAA family ATPase [Patescibacteria group bacterium]